MAKASVWRNSRRVPALYRYWRAGCLWSVNFIQHLRPAGIIKRVSVTLFMMYLAAQVAGAEANKVTSQRILDPRLPKYFVTKEREARVLTKQLKLQVAPEVWAYFD